MALPRFTQDTVPAATISPKIQPSLTAYYDDLKPGSKFIRDISGIIEQATACVEHYLAAHKDCAGNDKPAIVLDIDDTSVSNHRDIFDHDGSNSDDLVILRYRAANQPAIEPVLNFYQNVTKLGISVFFITARKPHPNQPDESLRSCTIKTLEHAGYKDWKGLYLPEGKEDLGLSSAQFKIKTRKAITEQGYTIIANIGDQPSDLEGDDPAHSFKLPNYLYPKLGLPVNPIVETLPAPLVLQDKSPSSPLASQSIFKVNHADKSVLPNDQRDVTQSYRA